MKYIPCEVSYGEKKGIVLICDRTGVPADFPANALKDLEDAEAFLKYAQKGSPTSVRMFERSEMMTALENYRVDNG